MGSDKICDRLRANDFDWFYTQDGRNAIQDLSPHLDLTTRNDLTAALDRHEYGTIRKILEPIVCAPGPTPPPPKEKRDPLTWLIPLLAALFLLLLLWWLLASCMDDWQRKNHDEPEPSPTVPTSPSPSPAAQSSFSLYFDTGSADLDTADAEAIKKAAADAKGNYSVTVVGVTDGTGSDQLNATLAEARAKHVEAALVEKGVDPAQIKLDKSPESVTTADTQSRRVDILVVPE